MTKNFDCSDEYVDGLAALLRTPDFFADGDCVAEDPTMWDDEASDSEKARALDICAGCPVRELCASWASLNEITGVWGGVEQATRDAKRSGRVFVTMEDRRKDVEWRSDIASAKPATELAEKWEVSERTIYRWRAEQAA